MNFDQICRDRVSEAFNGYLESQPTKPWTTLWYQPSKLEPEIVKLIAVVDQEKAAKGIAKHRDEIQNSMKASPETQALKLYMDVMMSAEFHRIYQAKSGFELLNEWNGDVVSARKTSVLGAWFRSQRSIRVVLPALIAMMLFLLLKTYLKVSD
jgi:hypothetical protein